MNLRPKRRPVPIIPIVSMIDILVILLIFFIATTTFRGKPKAHLQVALPESQSVGSVDPRPDARTAITVTKDQKLFLDGQPVAVDKLQESLAELHKKNPAAKLEFEADSHAALGLLVKIWDALRSAGYSVNDVPVRIEKNADVKPGSIVK